MSYTEILYQNGLERLEKDLDDFEILKSLKKFKASFTHLLKNESNSDLKAI